MYKVALGLLIVALMGCSSYKQVACSGKDWYQLGFDTAATGKSVRTFDSYRDQCGSDLEDIAMDQYLDGYTKGIVGYCTYDNGYELGSTNRQVVVTCPHEIREEFEKGYHQGLAVFSQKEDMMGAMVEEQNRKFGERSLRDTLPDAGNR